MLLVMARDEAFSCNVVVQFNNDRCWQIIVEWFRLTTAVRVDVDDSIKFES